MLEVVFSHSTYGAMLAAIEHQQQISDKQTIIYGEALSDMCEADLPKDIEIFLHQEQERELQGWHNAIPFENKKENIINLPLSLSVGHISQNGIGPQREEAISLLIGVFPDLADEVVQETLITARKSFAYLQKQVQNNEPLRIWISHEPDVQCGLYWLMEQLRPFGLEKLNVFVVELPEWEQREDGCIVQYSGWPEIPPYRFGELALLTKKLPVTLLYSYANRWQELQQEDSMLRAKINGQLVSVPESFYDPFIFRELEKQENEFNEARLIGQILGKYQLGISDAWIALRIEQVIQEGILTPITICKPDRPIYHRVLKKTGKS